MTFIEFDDYDSNRTSYGEKKIEQAVRRTEKCLINTVVPLQNRLEHKEEKEGERKTKKENRNEKKEIKRSV